MKKQKMDEGPYLSLYYDSIYEDEKLMSIGGRGHEIVALYRSFVREYGKCDADKYYFCNKIKMPYSSFLKKVNELKQAGYLPADLFGITGVIKRPRKSSQSQNELNSNSNLTQVYLNSNSGLTQFENAMPLKCAPPKNNKNNNAEGSPDGSPSENKINKTVQQETPVLQHSNSENQFDNSQPEPKLETDMNSYEDTIKSTSKASFKESWNKFKHNPQGSISTKAIPTPEPEPKIEAVSTGELRENGWSEGYLKGKPKIMQTRLSGPESDRWMRFYNLGPYRKELVLKGKKI